MKTRLRLIGKKSNKPVDIHELDPASLTYVASFFAHELRNPLTAIIGFSQFLQHDEVVKNNPKLSSYIAVIEQESNRMDGVIEELLRFAASRYNRDRFQRVNVKQCLQNVLFTYRLLAEKKNIDIVSSVSDDIYVLANGEQLEKVFINIIKNAIESIKDDGTIYIDAKEDGDYAHISFIDTGPGIPDEKISKLFQPFFTTKQTGTGIGLAICKTMIESFNGTITISNDSSLGAHVKISLLKTSKIENSNED